MNNASRFGTLVVLAFLLMPWTPASGQDLQMPAPDEMTVWHARRILQGKTPSYVTIRINAESIDFDYRSPPSIPLEQYTVDLKTLDPVAARCSTSGGKYKWFRCEIEYKDGRPIPSPEKKGRAPIPAKDRPPVKELFRLTWWDSCLAGKQEEEAVVRFNAETFAAAINHLREFAVNPSHPLRNFQQQATAWRALASKPPIPDEVKLQRMLAEEAVKEKQPWKALVHYEAGLELCPTWPQGYFNAALIAAELKFYAQAVEHMQSYLELAPDAADAQSARDQLAIWQYKAKGTK